MEKKVTCFGFGIFMFCLFMAFFTTNVWLWGCGVGLLICGFGWYFWEE